VTVRRADGFGTRLRGLAFRRTAGQPLYFPRCRSVHTIGMRFALDLIWVDGGGDTVRIDRDVGAWRVRSCREAFGVIECEAGQADAVLATLDRSCLR
jgi:uncharacterized protein